MSDWKRTRSGDRGDLPDRPVRPVLRRYLTEDVTLPALAQVLAENPQGLLMARDELSGWIRSFDQFTSAPGSDVARWLEMYRAGSLSVDRKGTGHLFVPRAAVSICGTIQDAIMIAAFTGEHQENGLLARFLLARPPEPEREWRSDRSASVVADEIAGRVARLVLLDLPAEGEQPQALRLTSEAEGRYQVWFDEHNRRRHATDPGPFRAFLAKAEELPARLGLVFALSRADEPAAVTAVDEDAMRRALELTDWFVREVDRVLRMFSETAEEQAARELVEWVRARELVTARDVAKGMRRYRGKGGSDRAEIDLKARVDAGDLVAIDQPGGEQGGRPTVVYGSPDTVGVGRTPSSQGDPGVSPTPTHSVTKRGKTV